MFAVIVNTLAIAIASLIGLCLRRGMTRNITDAVMQALGICTVLIGIQGAVSEKHVLLLIISVVIGVIIGEWGGLGWSCESLGGKGHRSLHQIRGCGWNSQRLCHLLPHYECRSHGYCRISGCRAGGGLYYALHEIPAGFCKRYHAECRHGHRRYGFGGFYPHLPGGHCASCAVHSSILFTSAYRGTIPYRKSSDSGYRAQYDWTY